MTDSSSAETAYSAIGIYGGTFDPIHLGHTRTVSELMGLTDMVDVRFVPAGAPPHRDRPAAAPRHRLAMTRLATAEMPGAQVDDRELYRHGPSYTIDTLESFHADAGGRPLCLILGLDAALGLESWYRWPDILDLAGLLVMVRPDYSLPAALPEWWQPTPRSVSAPAPAGTIRIVPVTPTDASSTAVRRAIALGETLDNQLHPDVWRYIQTHHLYS